MKTLRSRSCAPRTSKKARSRLERQSLWMRVRAIALFAVEGLIGAVGELARNVKKPVAIQTRLEGDSRFQACICQPQRSVEIINADLEVILQLRGVGRRQRPA